MATSKMVASADNAGRKGSGPSRDHMGDPGPAYPPTTSEERRMGVAIVRWVFRDHECRRMTWDNPGDGPCVLPSHGERVAVVRELLAYMFGPANPARGSHH